MDNSYQHLLGRSFEWGKTDCYALVRDFYKDVFDIELRNYARTNEWNPDKGDNLFMMGFDREGFNIFEGKVTDIQFGDVFLIAFNSARPNHCGIYVGDNKMLHHCTNNLSRENTYSGGWRSITVAILRHNDVKERKPDLPPVDLIDLLPERKRRKIKDALDKIDKSETA